MAAAAAAALGIINPALAVDPDPAGKVSTQLQPVYRIGCESSFMPFSWVEDGVCRGIDIEILAEIARRQGFRYELYPQNFTSLLPKLSSGLLDAAVGGVSITQKRAQILDFSDPYFRCGLALAARENSQIKSLNDLFGKTAVVKYGSLGSYFAETNMSRLDLKIIYVEDSPSMVKVVMQGKADFYTEDQPVMIYHMAQHLHPGLHMAIEELPPQVWGYALAVSRGSVPELVAMFNQGLAELKADGTYQRIVKKYFGDLLNPRWVDLPPAQSGSPAADRGE